MKCCRNCLWSTTVSGVFECEIAATGGTNEYKFGGELVKGKVPVTGRVAVEPTHVCDRYSRCRGNGNKDSGVGTGNKEWDEHLSTMSKKEFDRMPQQ